MQIGIHGKKKKNLKKKKKQNRPASLKLRLFFPLWIALNLRFVPAQQEHLHIGQVESVLYYHDKNRLI